MTATILRNSTDTLTLQRVLILANNSKYGVSMDETCTHISFGNISLIADEGTMHQALLLGNYWSVMAGACFSLPVFPLIYPHTRTPNHAISHVKF